MVAGIDRLSGDLRMLLRATQLAVGVSDGEALPIPEGIGAQVEAALRQALATSEAVRTSSQANLDRVALAAEREALDTISRARLVAAGLMTEAEAALAEARARALDLVDQAAVQLAAEHERAQQELAELRQQAERDVGVRNDHLLATARASALQLFEDAAEAATARVAADQVLLDERRGRLAVLLDDGRAGLGRVLGDGEGLPASLAS